MAGGNQRFIRRARRKIAKLMRSSCRIYRITGERQFNPATGEYDPPTTVELYSGPCQIKPASSPAERELSVGDRETTLRVYELKLPWAAADATPIDVADRVVITSSDETWLVGKDLPVGWAEYADSRIRRTLYVWTQEQGLTNDG